MGHNELWVYWPVNDQYIAPFNTSKKKYVFEGAFKTGHSLWVQLFTQMQFNHFKH